MSNESEPSLHTSKSQEGEAAHAGEEGKIPLYLKLAYIIILIWSVVYFLLYF